MTDSPIPSSPFVEIGDHDRLFIHHYPSAQCAHFVLVTPGVNTPWREKAGQSIDLSAAVSNEERGQLLTQFMVQHDLVSYWPDIESCMQTMIQPINLSE